MYNTGIPMDAVIFTIIWLISFVVAIAVGLIASKKMNKAVNVEKGVLIGLGFWVFFSLILVFIPLNGMGSLAGTFGNIAAAFMFWTSPTKEEYIKILQEKDNKKKGIINKTQSEKEK